jgi:hypothetical protein
VSDVSVQQSVRRCDLERIRDAGRWLALCTQAPQNLYFYRHRILWILGKENVTLFCSMSCIHRVACYRFSLILS